jgi:hypothetical protein
MSQTAPRMLKKLAACKWEFSFLFYMLGKKNIKDKGDVGWNYCYNVCTLYTVNIKKNILTFSYPEPLFQWGIKRSKTEITGNHGIRIKNHPLELVPFALVDFANIS